MPLVVGINDLDPSQVDRPSKNTGPGFPGAYNTNFFRATADTPDAPTARINRFPPGKNSQAHFHQVDQFQIIVNGEGEFGRHHVSPYCVHFSRAHTPYGPLLSDKVTGWAFMVLRSRYDPGGQRLPQARDKLNQVAGRTPWQVTKKVEFPIQNTGACLQDIPEIKDDQGLFARTLSMAPNSRTTAPDPSGGDGQYVVALKGSLIHDGQERKAPAVVFIKPSEEPFQVQAGALGLEGVVLNFPKVAQRGLDAKTPSAAAGFRKWQCELCSFAYDEELGMPHEGIPAGTRWDDVPQTWSCPDCSASKTDFQMIAV